MQTTSQSAEEIEGESQARRTPSAGVEASGRDRLFGTEPVPLHIGRFRVLELIGQGGMGVVYAAYDEQLDRKVAVKVLVEDELPRPEDRLRFLREAQALARLSHPHVVTVHEVGESQGRFFLAMEYIRGDSVDAWLCTKPDWRQVLEVFILAGRGLVAAHRADLVHRDLKPANIMRGENGVVKVLDFGLARTVTDDSLDEASMASSSSSSSALHSSLTETGAVMGTPAYMAPEQLSGGAVDARSDQYSFCVALWEGLSGGRPFAGPSFETMRVAKLEGPPGWPEKASPVPRTVVDALRRGLATDPAQRWPSMEALLEALSWSHRRRRNRGLWGLAAVGVLGVGGATARTWSDAEQQRCSGAQQQLAGIWDGARRDEVETAMLGVGQPYAQDVWDRAAPKLDAYSSAWEAMYTEACEAATVRAEQSPEMMDRRMQCLHRVAGELRATVDTLADVDTTVLSNTHKLVTSLPSLSQCEGAQAMVTELAAPLPTEADAVRAARGQLSRAKTLRTAGRYEAAQEAIAAAAATLEGVGYGPVRTELTLERGLVLHRLGEYVESERALKAAMAHASQWQQHGLLTDAVKNLMHVVGYKQQRIEAAMLLVPLLKGLSCADPVREAAARNAFANVLLVQGKYAEAEAEQRVALALRERTLSADHPHIALSFNNLAILLARQGKFLEAEAMFRTALTRRRKALGAHHPDVASSRNNLALVLAEQSKFEAAEAEHRKALASRRNALGPNHPDVAWSHNNIGIMLGHQGRHAEAEAEFRMAWSLWETTKGSSGARVGTFRNNLGDALWGQGKDAEAEVEFRAARSLFEQTLGTAHPDWAMAGSNLATLLESRGRYEEAEREARAALSSYEQAGTLEGHAAALARNSLGLALQGQGRYEEGQAELETALTVLVEKLGAEHLDSITAHQRLGTTLWRRGKHEEAEAEYRTALTLREKVQGLDHPEVASTRTVLADVLLRLGRQAEALSLAEQAWARSQRDDIDASDRAATAFVLARILWSIEGAARDRRRAKELADTALRIYRADEEAEHDDEREVEQWLSTHAAKRARR